MIMKTKKALTNQVLILIFMIILMIGIILFGLNKLASVGEIISKQEKIELQEDLKKAFGHCNNPLNKGSVSRITVDQPRTNVICVLGNDQGSYSSISEFSELSQTKDNVVFLDADLNKVAEDSYEIDSKNYQILDSFHADFGGTPKTICWDDKNTGTITIAITCGS